MLNISNCILLLTKTFELTLIDERYSYAFTNYSKGMQIQTRIRTLSLEPENLFLKNSVLVFFVVYFIYIGKDQKNSTNN